MFEKFALIVEFQNYDISAFKTTKKRVYYFRITKEKYSYEVRFLCVRQEESERKTKIVKDTPR